MKSYMQKEKECYLCRKLYDLETTQGLHLHHIYEGIANRSRSDEMGAVVWLCGYHHNLSNFGIHFNKERDLELKREAQMKYEETHSREEFMALIGRNYLDE